MSLINNAILAVCLLGLTYYFGYTRGTDAVEKDIRIANERHEAAMLQQKLVLVRLNKQLETKTHANVTTIKKAVDQTGCADTAVPADIIDSLH